MNYNVLNKPLIAALQIWNTALKWNLSLQCVRIVHRVYHTLTQVGFKSKYRLHCQWLCRPFLNYRFSMAKNKNLKHSTGKEIALLIESLIKIKICSMNNFY